MGAIKDGRRILSHEIIQENLPELKDMSFLNSLLNAWHDRQQYIQAKAHSCEFSEQRGQNECPTERKKDIKYKGSKSRLQMIDGIY